MRTVTYTTARLSCFLYVYDWMNPDARRIPRIDSYIYSGMVGGFLAGVITNPVELVFTRQQADELYPKGARRNYKNFLDGLFRVT